ncbi:MAG: hypothetical protein RBT11_05665 [Desulfobacterales bacterium]|jgi:Fe-S cluster assembly iron-binding protein IscA|nr:hypothetical protein [Desulfobacterales bacterium]
MVTITEEAQKQVLRYFKGKKIEPVRISLTNACSGQQLALVTDTIRRDDRAYHYGKLTFVIEKSLLDLGQPLHIDFTPGGFTIDSRMQLNLNCSGCGKAISCKKEPGKTFIRSALPHDAAPSPID